MTMRNGLEVGGRMVCTHSHFRLAVNRPKNTYKTVNSHTSATENEMFRVFYLTTLFSAMSSYFGGFFFADAQNERKYPGNGQISNLMKMKMDVRIVFVLCLVTGGRTKHQFRLSFRFVQKLKAKYWYLSIGPLVIYGISNTT